MKFLKKVPKVIAKYIVQYEQLCEESGKTPKAIFLQRMPEAWACCDNVNNILYFSPDLFLMPEWVIEYVVVHELCHLKYSNHGADFLELGEKYYKGFKNLEKYWPSGEEFSLVQEALDNAYNEVRCG